MVAAATERATCDGQFENLTAKIDSLKNLVDNINITILLNQYIRYFSSVCCFKLQLVWLYRYKVYKILASVGIDKPRFTVVSRDTPASSGEGFVC